MTETNESAEARVQRGEVARLMAVTLEQMQEAWASTLDTIEDAPRAESLRRILRDTIAEAQTLRLEYAAEALEKAPRRGRREEALIEGAPSGSTS